MSAIGTPGIAGRPSFPSVMLSHAAHGFDRQIVRGLRRYGPFWPNALIEQ